MPAHPIPIGKRLRSTYRCTLKHQSHRPEELCAFLIEGLKTPVETWSRPEKTAVQDWKDWLASWPNLCQSNNDIVPSAEEMNKALKLVSVVFFCGQLDRCTFAWRKNLFYDPSGKRIHKGPFGYCQPYGVGSSFETFISQDPADLSKERKDIDNRTSKIGTFLHECVHAFILLYSCSTSHHQGCKDEDSADEQCYNWGNTGHGTTFIQIASHVEGLQNALTDVHASLTISTQLWHEFNASTTYVGLRPGDIEKCHPKCHARLHGFSKDYRVVKKIEGAGSIGFVIEWYDCEQESEGWRDC